MWGAVAAELEACVCALCMHACGMMQHRPLPLESPTHMYRCCPFWPWLLRLCMFGCHASARRLASRCEGGGCGSGFGELALACARCRAGREELALGQETALAAGATPGQRDSCEVLPSSGRASRDAPTLVGMLKRGVVGGVFAVCALVSLVFPCVGAAIPWPGATPAPLAGMAQTGGCIA